LSLSNVTNRAFWIDAASDRPCSSGTTLSCGYEAPGRHPPGSPGNVDIVAGITGRIFGVVVSAVVP
jgi:hypothetical protein